MCYCCVVVVCCCRCVSLCVVVCRCVSLCVVVCRCVLLLCCCVLLSRFSWHFHQLLRHLSTTYRRTLWDAVQGDLRHGDNLHRLHERRRNDLLEQLHHLNPPSAAQERRGSERTGTMSSMGAAECRSTRPCGTRSVTDPGRAPSSASSSSSNPKKEEASVRRNASCSSCPSPRALANL